MFERITPEMSLKPFRQTDEAYVRAVCARMFDEWRPLLRNRKTVAVMLWVGDGSEMLDYRCDLQDTFEWCRFVGTANLPYPKEGEPAEISLHERKRDYTAHAPVMTYAVLKRIVSCLKEEGKKAFPGADIQVGETFDIGPEFAVSDFKYNRHPEICSGARIGNRYGFVDATALLHADSRRYAAYPDGIPEGTPFGTFLGKQAEIFLRDMGFDYLWLSNGLGFSDNPWNKVGKIFDGETYYPEKLAATKGRVFEFWKLFRHACTFPLETRGTNHSVGIDYATDGVPLYDIYNADLDITAPPNSPWAAINDNHGLEMMGHMTRVCALPNGRFPFRYYIHDPWWVNSPWYDRYDGAPCDIYLPMAISRINAEGKTETANSLNILSVDNSYGDMPEACVNEPLPHLLKAEKDAADAPAPLVWVYPMREYTTSCDKDLLKEMNIGDNFICDAINDGLPLCSVVSTDNFLRHTEEIYKKSILISPVPESKAVKEQLQRFAKAGIGVIIYGTKEKLAALSRLPEFVLIDAESDAGLLRESLGRFGYRISFTKKTKDVKPPTMAVSRHDRALFFSVYNADTTTDTHFLFPLGAPILVGCEAEMKDGHSTYRFARGEHRECRVFVGQENGVISCREAPPVNVRYRRAVKIAGLRDATVCLFPEEGCEAAVSVAENTDVTPKYDPRFAVVHDEVYGTYLRGEHIDGHIYFLMGRKKKS